MHEEEAGHWAELGALVLVPGLHFHLPQVLILSFSFFIVKRQVTLHFSLILISLNVNSPQTAQSSSLRKLHSLVQPIHFSVIRSLVA